MRIQALFFTTLALALAQTSFADVSGCVNRSTSPITIGDIVYTQFDCSLYNDASTYTIDLKPLMTQGGASLSDNLVGPGYEVVINGDPNTLAPDSTGLFNQNLWVAVLYWPGDQDTGSASDSLTVYWPGAFPTASDVQTFDMNLYPDAAVSDFFIPRTGDLTVYAPGNDGTNVNYDAYSVITPEPGAVLLLGFQLAILGGVVLGMRRRSRRVR